MSNTEINKDEAIKLIAGRIIDEHRKYSQIETWPKITAEKLYNQWLEFFQSERDSLKEQLNSKEVAITARDFTINELEGDLKLCQSLAETQLRKWVKRNSHLKEQLTASQSLVEELKNTIQIQLTALRDYENKQAK